MAWSLRAWSRDVANLRPAKDVLRDIRLHKPAPLGMERHERRLKLEAVERTEKTAAKRRDGNRCRWPDCRYRIISARTEVAHLHASGMGGDPTSLRMRRENLVTLCPSCDQGPVSLHSGDLRVEPLTDRGTDGPCRFLVRSQIDLDQWDEVARESAVCVVERGR